MNITHWFLKNHFEPSNRRLHEPQPFSDMVDAGFQGLVEMLDNVIRPDGPEKTVGMRKLLEARDCFQRALIEADYERNGDE